MADGNEPMNDDALELLRSIDGNLERIVEVLAAMAFVDEERGYTKQEAARVLRCSIRTIERRVREGHLVAVRRGTKSRVTGRSLAAMMRATPAPGHRRTAVEVQRL